MYTIVGFFFCGMNNITKKDISMKKLLLVVFVVSLFVFASISAGSIEHKKEIVKINDAEKIVVNCDLGAGEFRISPANMDEAAIINISYDPRRVKYFVESEIQGNKCIIDLESERRKRSSIDTEENRWDIEFSTKYPMSINLDIGACDADFDLGGIPLTDFDLDIGAASGEILFSEPNPERLKEIEIDAGASSLEMNMIGNANFERFTFSGGAGSFELDFRGEYEGTSHIDIDIGLGSGDIVLPKGVPVRIESDGSNWFSSIDIHGNDLYEVDDDIFESDDFESAKTKIIISLNVGMGSIDIRFKK